MKKKVFKVITYNGEDKPVEELNARNEKEAKELMKGINLNLDHSQYYVEIKEVE